VGAGSRRVEAAEALVVEFGGTAYSDLNRLLDEPSVELVVNLTTAAAHAGVTARCLDAGKHVYSEKPLAGSAEEAHELVARAAALGVGLSVAPSTHLSAPQQTVIRCIADGRLGRVHVVRCDARWGRIESWHPRPDALLAAGPVVDVAPYPLTLVTAALGPATRTTAASLLVAPRRKRLDGRVIDLTTDDHVEALVELANGALIQLTSSFFAFPDEGARGRMEFIGEKGTLILDSVLVGDAGVSFVSPDGIKSDILVDGARSGIDFGLGLEELAESIEEGTPIAADRAAHVAAIIEAIIRSADVGLPEWIRSG
jgi:alcohol dehydrogenase (NADP+)